MIKDFITFIKTYGFHQYKDETWYTNNPKFHSWYKKRKYYTDEQLEQLFLEHQKK